MRPLWNAPVVECARCGMRPLWNAPVVECARCGMRPLWNAPVVECARCGMRLTCSRWTTVFDDDWLVAVSALPTLRSYFVLFAALARCGIAAFV